MLICTLMGEVIYLFIGMWAVVVGFFIMLPIYGYLYINEKIWIWYVIFPVLFIAAALRAEYVGHKEDICWGETYVVYGKVSKVVKKENSKQIYLYNAHLLRNDIMQEGYEKVAHSDNAEIVKGIVLSIYEDESLKYDSDDYVSKEQLKIISGDEITFAGKITQYDVARNPGNFDYRRYYLSSNITAHAKLSGGITIVKPTVNVWIKGIFALKEKLSGVYDEISIGDDAGVYKSIVLGDKSELDLDIKKLYQENGMAHILAISGLHISILGMSLYKLLRRCLIPFLPSFLICMFLMISYGIMTGNSISAIRAIVMFLIMVYANVCGRKYDILSAVSFAGVITLFVFPYVVYNGGFWLSYLAVVGIIVLKPAFDMFFRIQEIKKELKRKKKNHLIDNKRLLWLRFKCFVLDAFCTSLAVSIMTMPVILFYYFEIPPYSVILNIIVIPLMTFVMMGAVLGGICGMIWIPFGVFWAGISHYILIFYGVICKVFMKLPGANLIVGKPAWWELVLAYGVIVMAIILTYRQNSRYAVSVLLSGLILSLKVPSNYVRMLDVGQGDCIHISYENTHLHNKNILIDGGSSNITSVGEYRIIPYLKSQGIKNIDYVFMSHADSDHTSGLMEIIDTNEIQIKCFVMPNVEIKSENYLKIENMLNENNIPIIYMAAGQKLSGQQININCLHPTKDYTYTDENNYSLVLGVDLDNVKYMFTGDIGDEGENYIIERKRENGDELTFYDIDVLKVAHHGSKYSTDMEFIDIVKPEISIISCGVNNRYGHPHAETIDRLKNTGSDIFVTSGCGAITVQREKDSVVSKGFLVGN